MPQYSRITKTRVTSLKGSFHIKKDVTNIMGADKKMFTIYMECSDKKKRRITFYDDEIDLLKNEINKDNYQRRTVTL